MRRNNNLLRTLYMSLGTALLIFVVAVNGNLSAASEADRIEIAGYEIEALLQQLSADESRYQEQIKDAQKEIDTIQKKISELQSRIPEETAKINSLIKEEENAIAKYNEKIEKNTLELEQKIKKNETQLASEEREEEIARLRNNITALRKHIASGRYDKYELEQIDRCKKSIEGYNKALSEGTYQWHGLHEGVGITINRKQDEIEEKLDYINTITTEFEDEKKRLKSEIEGLKKAKSSIEGKRTEKPKKAESQSKQSLLDLWNQRGYVEDVTNTERLAARKAYKEFISAKVAEPKAADIFDVYYYKQQKKRAELKEELKEKFPDADVPSERVDVGVLLDDIGLDTIAEQLITPEDVEEIEKSFDASMEAIGDVGEAFVETAERMQDAFDSIFDDIIPLDDEAAIEVPGTVKDEKAAEQVRELLDKPSQKDESVQKGEVAKNVKKLLKNEDSSFIESTTIDAFFSMMGEMSKPWSEHAMKLLESKDDKKKASGDKKKVKPDEKSYERKAAEYLGGKGIDKGMDIAKAKLIEKAKKKFIAKYGEAAFKKIDGVKGGYDKLLGWYDAGKAVYDTHKEMEKMNQSTGKGPAILYGSMKAGAAIITKVAGGPIVAAASTVIGMGADVVKAAAETDEKIFGYFDKTIPYAYNSSAFSNPANIFLKKAGRELEDDEGVGLTVGEKTYNVWGWKKYVREDGSVSYRGRDADGYDSGVYIKIDKRNCLKFWGTDTVTIYDRKTNKAIKTIKMKL